MKVRLITLSPALNCHEYAATAGLASKAATCNSATVTGSTYLMVANIVVHKHAKIKQMRRNGHEAVVQESERREYERETK